MTKQTKLIVKETKFKGNDMISIFDKEPEYNDAGELKTFPIISMGLRKAHAVAQAMAEIEIFVEAHADDIKAKLDKAEAKAKEVEANKEKAMLEYAKKNGLKIVKA